MVMEVSFLKSFNISVGNIQVLAGNQGRDNCNSFSILIYQGRGKGLSSASFAQANGSRSTSTK